MLSECTLKNTTINQAGLPTISENVKELKSVSLTHYQTKEISRIGALISK
jgi:hypothetical protein